MTASTRCTDGCHTWGFDGIEVCRCGKCDTETLLRMALSTEGEPVGDEAVDLFRALERLRYTGDEAVASARRRSFRLIKGDRGGAK